MVKSAKTNVVKNEILLRIGRRLKDHKRRSVRPLQNVKVLQIYYISHKNRKQGGKTYK